MSPPHPSLSPERFSWLEDADKDFPFYNGTPSALSARQWSWVLIMVVIGFLCLSVPMPGFTGPFAAFLSALLMPGIPLVALAGVAPKTWRALFGKVSGREIRWMFGFALLNLAVTMGIGALVHALTQVTANASTAQLNHLDTMGRIAFFAKTIPQLFGEELMTLLPFLALMQWFSKGLKVGRKAAVIAAWLITALGFGLLHLPTYGWNLAQCVIIIGSARLILTLPWIMTKNIWVSTGAHIINDWLLFTLGLLGASLASQA